MGRPGVWMRGVIAGRAAAGPLRGGMQRAWTDRKGVQARARQVGRKPGDVGRSPSV